MSAHIPNLHQDVVGEVRAFNYPRFVLKGFHFFGGGKGDLSEGNGDGSFSESLDDTIRIYTRQNRSMSHGVIFLPRCHIRAVQYALQYKMCFTTTYNAISPSKSL